MPVKVTTSKGKFEFIYTETFSKRMTLKNMKPEDFQVAQSRFFIEVRIRTKYLLPEVTQ